MTQREVYILYPPSVVGKKLCNNEFGLKPVSCKVKPATQHVVFSSLFHDYLTYVVGCLLRKKVSLVACTASCLWVQHSTASFMRWVILAYKLQDSAPRFLVEFANLKLLGFIVLGKNWSF